MGSGPEWSAFLVLCSAVSRREPSRRLAQCERFHVPAKRKGLTYIKIAGHSRQKRLWCCVRASTIYLA